MALGDIDEWRRVFAGDRPGGGAVAVVGSAVLETLRQGNQASSPGGRLGREVGGTGDVRGDITGGVELDEGDGQSHAAIVEVSEYPCRTPTRCWRENPPAP